VERGRACSQKGEGEKKNLAHDGSEKASPLPWTPKEPERTSETSAVEKKEKKKEFLTGDWADSTGKEGNRKK